MQWPLGFVPDRLGRRFPQLQRDPTSTIDLIAGSSSFPKSASSYFTLDGDVGMTLRVRTPRCSRSRSLLVITLAEMNGLSRRNSENRRGASLKDQSTSGAQQPSSRAVHLDLGEPGFR